MKSRFNYAEAAPGAYKAMLGLEQYLHECGLEESLIHLIKLRASQLNGCAYCLDMHWKDLRAIGEGEQRLYSLDAWRECPYYTDRERAAHIRTGLANVRARLGGPGASRRAAEAILRLVHESQPSVERKAP